MRRQSCCAPTGSESQKVIPVLAACWWEPQDDAPRFDSMLRSCLLRCQMASFIVIREDVQDADFWRDLDPVHASGAENGPDRYVSKVDSRKPVLHSFSQTKFLTRLCQPNRATAKPSDGEPRR